MGRLAVVAGHTVLGGDFAALLGVAADDRDVAVPGGLVRLADAGPVVLLQRHGTLDYVAAPWIDHHAHAAALVAVGCDRVLGVGSVGGLHGRVPVGTIVVPDDFVSLAAEPESRFRDARGHTVPGFDRPWRDRLVAAWSTRAARAPVDGGVYWQTTGPRFETPAEIRFLAMHADVVGMTIASECVAMAEAGLAYAAITVVDNLANGVRSEALTVEAFEAGKTANRNAVVETLAAVVEDLTR